jgi:hypothetical protein
MSIDAPSNNGFERTWPLARDEGTGKLDWARVRPGIPSAPPQNPRLLGGLARIR